MGRMSPQTHLIDFLYYHNKIFHVHVVLLATSELQNDYSQSYILTSDEFVASLEAKVVQKQALLVDAGLCNKES
jgi:hypothetical protein